MSIPIRKIDINDLHARYKMPIPELKLQNIDDISKALHIPSDIILTYFKKSLGTHKFNGQFSYHQILATLYNFIEKYILCENCKYPELKYCAKKNTLRTKCLACGHNILVSLNDPIWKKIHIITPERKSREPIYEFPDVVDNGNWSDSTSTIKTEMQHIKHLFQD
jgi:hypothetical protein